MAARVQVQLVSTSNSIQPWLHALISWGGGLSEIQQQSPSPDYSSGPLGACSEELWGHTFPFQTWLLGKRSRITASQDTEPTLEMKILKDSFYFIGF